jgi:hypothetical protein
MISVCSHLTHTHVLGQIRHIADCILASSQVQFLFFTLDFYSTPTGTTDKTIFTDVDPQTYAVNPQFLPSRESLVAIAEELTAAHPHLRCITIRIDGSTSEYGKRAISLLKPLVEFGHIPAREMDPAVAPPEANSTYMVHEPHIVELRDAVREHIRIDDEQMEEWLEREREDEERTRRVEAGETDASVEESEPELGSDDAAFYEDS